MTLAEAIDVQLRAPVLVFGSPPPAGRDLDLLVRPAEEARLRDWLEREGFLERGGEWVRFRDCAAESLDLVPLAAWGLAREASDELFEDARPVAGFSQLGRPAPRHVLLALARRLVAGDGRLTAKHRARIDAALAEDAEAWQAARRAAPGWSANRALDALEQAYRLDKTASRAARAAALAEWPYAQGRSPARARVRAWLEAGHAGRPRAHLITFSGLDGAGKTSQAEALRETLERLGWEVSMQWVRLEWTTLWESRWLGIVGWPARAILGLLARLRKPSGVGASPPALTPTAVRQRSGLVANAWVTVVALVHAAAQRRETLERLGWEVSMQWVRLEWTTLWESRWLGIVGWPARTTLRLLARLRRPSGGGASAPALTPTAVRQRSGLVANAWVTVVALVHAAAQRRETRPHLRPGTIVICDRYSLDAAAHVRFRYGESHPFTFQIRLVERLSPRPLRAYFMDVPPETAHARKAEQYSLEDLTRQARLYREEAAALGTRRLDGERPREELCAEIAEDVWRALG